MDGKGNWKNIEKYDDLGSGRKIGIATNGDGKWPWFSYMCGYLNNSPLYCRIYPTFGIDRTVSFGSGGEDIIKKVNDILRVNKDMLFKIDIVPSEEVDSPTFDYETFEFSWNNNIKELDEFFVKNIKKNNHPLHCFFAFLEQDFKKNFNYDRYHREILRLIDGLDFSLKLLDNTLKELKTTNLTKKIEELKSLLQREHRNTNSAWQAGNESEVRRISLNYLSSEVEKKFNEILSLTKPKTEIPEEQDMKFEGNEINNDSCSCCKGCSLFSCCRPCGCCKGS